LKMNEFSETEQKAIDEKLEQLKQFKSGTLTPEQLAAIITTRRVDWIEANLEDMLKKYDGLNIEEAAYHIIYFEHMRINPADSKMTRVSSTKIMVDSYNFCPYLEACKQLRLNTKFICKEVGEPSIQEMARQIHPRIQFARDYEIIRPDAQFCREYFEFV